MPIIKILLNQKGNVVGTARVDTAPSGTGAPQQFAVVARPGQRIVEVEMEDQVASLDPSALHAAVASKYIKRGATKPNSAGRGKVTTGRKPRRRR